MPDSVERTEDPIPPEVFTRARAGDRNARNRVVERHMGLAAHIARRFSGSSNADDVRQAAMIGLIKAADRFDPSHGTSFATFAGVTIEGELKRFLRDRSWVVSVPRSAKELHAVVRAGVEELGQKLHRSPTVAELSEHLGIDRDDVLRGLAASAASSVVSFERPVRGTTVEHAQDDSGFAQLLNREAVTSLIDRLAPREREIVRLRFFDELSQSEIAERLDLSQMHVSRLLKRAFERLRSLAGPEDS
jgi:RNA polymerase sigma-B factor